MAGAMGAVGTSRASISDGNGSIWRTNSSLRYWALKVSVALNLPALLMMLRTVVFMSVAWLAINSSTAAWRSATQGPSYSSAANSSIGVKYSGTSSMPAVAGGRHGPRAVLQAAAESLLPDNQG